MPAPNPHWCVPDPDDPKHWLASSPLLDLDDPKLRLRVQSLTQLCKTDREKALALYAFVKRIPFAHPFKMRLHTAREVLQQPCADSADKATLWVALMRIAGFAARIRYLTLDTEVLRGLPSAMPQPLRPVVEVFRDGRWVGTDSYIFDAAYSAAALRRLQVQGWARGYAIHVDAQLLWDGLHGAYLGAWAPDDDPMVLHDHGVYCDPLEFFSSPEYRETHARLARAVRWNVLAPAIERAIRELREHALPAPEPNPA